MGASGVGGGRGGGERRGGGKAEGGQLGKERFTDTVEFPLRGQ